MTTGYSAARDWECFIDCVEMLDYLCEAWIDPDGHVVSEWFACRNENIDICNTACFN